LSYNVFMRIYKISKKSGKTRRDSGNKLFYHVSPEKISYFKPFSKMYGQNGIFLSSTYRSAITDWTPYVIHKKEKQHPLQQQWNDLWNKQWDIKEKLEKTNNEDEKAQLYIDLDAIGEKLEKLRGSFNSDSFQSNQKPYQTAYVHKVSVPRSVLQDAEEFMKSAIEGGYASGNMGFWAWGEQTFFPEHLLSQLEVVGIKELNFGEFQKEYSQLMKKQQYYNPNKGKKPEDS
jgi:hypothetical protein